MAITIHQEGNYIILDLAGDDDIDVAKANACKETPHKLSVTERLNGVRNNQCEQHLNAVTAQLARDRLARTSRLQLMADHIRYEYKVLRLDQKRTIIEDKKRADPGLDTTYDEKILLRGANYLKYDAGSSSYLNKKLALPLRMGKARNGITPLIASARKALERKRQSDREQGAEGTGRTEGRCARKGKATSDDKHGRHTSAHSGGVREAAGGQPSQGGRPRTGASGRASNEEEARNGAVKPNAKRPAGPKQDPSADKTPTESAPTGHRSRSGGSVPVNKVHGKAAATVQEVGAESVLTASRSNGEATATCKSTESGNPGQAGNQHVATVHRKSLDPDGGTGLRCKNEREKERCTKTAESAETAKRDPAKEPAVSGTANDRCQNVAARQPVKASNTGVVALAETYPVGEKPAPRSQISVVVQLQRHGGSVPLPGVTREQSELGRVGSRPFQDKDNVLLGMQHRKTLPMADIKRMMAKWSVENRAARAGRVRANETPNYTLASVARRKPSRSPITIATLQSEQTKLDVKVGEFLSGLASRQTKAGGLAQKPPSANRRQSAVAAHSSLWRRSLSFISAARMFARPISRDNAKLWNIKSKPTVIEYNPPPDPAMARQPAGVPVHAARRAIKQTATYRLHRVIANILSKQTRAEALQYERVKREMMPGGKLTPEPNTLSRIPELHRLGSDKAEQA